MTSHNCTESFCLDTVCDRRVAWNNPGWGLGLWGVDLAKVDAISTAATFGQFWGPNKGRVQFNSVAAAEAYRDLTVDEALDLIREAVMSAEVEWNTQFAKAKNGREDRLLLGYTSGALVQAPAYGWRETYKKALNCLKCLWRELKVKYGPRGLERGFDEEKEWVLQRNWRCDEDGVVYATNSSGAPSTKTVGSVDQCKSLCSADSHCRGFTRDG